MKSTRLTKNEVITPQFFGEGGMHDVQAYVCDDERNARQHY